MIYKYISDNIVTKIDDAGISRLSCSISNPEYLAWLSEGNTPLPIDQPTPAELFAAIEAAIESHHDAVARAGGYRDADRCVSYAGCFTEYQVECIRFAQWRAACWALSNIEQNKIITGMRTNIPTPSEAVAELPLFDWSAV